MSAFDDEFGLFSEEAEESERRSTLGARKIASNETVIDDVEPEDDAPRRRGTGGERRSGGYAPRGGSGGGRRPAPQHRAPADPAASQKRAGELLEFLAKKLVSKPESVSLESYPAEGGEQPLLELVVDPDDLGKVIGRNGRMAQALRTIVRATAEGKIAVDILDTDEFLDEDAGEEADDAKE